MKNKTSDMLNFFLAAVLLAVAAFAATKASATDKITLSTPKQSQGQSQAAYGGDSESMASATAGGGDGGSVSVQGHDFYALSLMFPEASGCFTGVQGGAKDNSSGFLGFHILNKSCWADKMASMEQDININARLKCADRHYRNALAYDVPRRERRDACVRMKVDSGRKQMAQFQETIADLERKNAVLLKERAYDRKYAEEAAARCESEKDKLEERCTK